MMMTPDEDRQTAVNRAVDEAVTVPADFAVLMPKFDSVISAFSPELEKIQEKVDLCEAIEAVFQARMEPLLRTENEYHTGTWEEFRRWKWRTILNAFRAAFWGRDPLPENASVAVQSSRWLLENDRGYDPTFHIGSFQRIRRISHQRDLFLYINRILALDLPDAESRGYVRTILERPFMAPTQPCKLEEVLEILRLKGRLEHSMLEYLRRFCRTVYLQCELVTEDWANLDDNDIEIIVELGQFMSCSMATFLRRVLLRMNHDISWTIKLSRAMNGFTWFSDLSLELPYQSIITKFVEQFQEQKEIDKSGFKERMSQMLHHISATTMRNRDAIL